MANIQQTELTCKEHASSSGNVVSVSSVPGNAKATQNNSITTTATAAGRTQQPHTRSTSSTHPHIAAAILPSQHTLNAIAASPHIRQANSGSNNTINNNNIPRRNASSASLSSSSTASSTSSSSDTPLYYPIKSDSSRVVVETAATTWGTAQQQQIPKSATGSNRNFQPPTSSANNSFSPPSTSVSTLAARAAGGASTADPSAKTNKSNISHGLCRTTTQPVDSTTTLPSSSNLAQSAVQTAAAAAFGGTFSAMPVTTTDVLAAGTAPPSQAASGMSANNVAVVTQAPVSTHTHKNPLYVQRPVSKLPAHLPPPTTVPSSVVSAPLAGSSFLSTHSSADKAIDVLPVKHPPPYIAKRFPPSPAGSQQQQQQHNLPVVTTTANTNTDKQLSPTVNNKAVATPTKSSYSSNSSTTTTLLPTTTAVAVLSSPAPPESSTSMSHPSSSSSVSSSSTKSNTISTSTITTTSTTPSPQPTPVNTNNILHGIASRGLQLSNLERSVGRPLQLRSASFDSTSSTASSSVSNKFGKPSHFRIISTSSAMNDGKATAGGGSLADVTATITLSRPSAGNTSGAPQTSGSSSSGISAATTSSNSTAHQQQRKPTTTTGGSQPAAQNPKPISNWNRTTTQNTAASSKSPSRTPAGAVVASSPPSSLLTVNDMVRRRSSGAYSTDSQSTTGGSDTTNRSMRSLLSGSLCSVATAIESYPGDWQSMKTASTHGSSSSLNTFVTVQGDSYYEQTMERMRRTMDDLKKNLSAKDEHLKRLEQFNTDMKQQNRNLRNELDAKTTELRDVQQQNQPTTTASSPTKTSGLGTSFLYRKQKTTTPDEIGPLKTRVKELEKQVADLTKAKERSDRDTNDIKTTLKEVIDNVERTPITDLVNDLKKKYEAAESMCEELMDENDDLKKEQRELESEMEEMGDRFRQHESVELQDLQRELESATKTSRILQFKLRKAERHIEDLEAAQNATTGTTNRLKPSTSTGKLSPSTSMLDARDLDPRALQTELKMAREVSLRLQTQLESVEETKATLLQEKDNLRRHLMEVERERDTYQELNDSLKADLEKLGAKPSTANPPPSSPSSLRVSSNQQPSLVKQCSTEEYSTLLRNLCDATERENDLREQKRFVEDEAKRLRKQLADVEGENESLHVQLRKLTNARTKLNAALPSTSSTSSVSSSATNTSSGVSSSSFSSDWKAPNIDELQMQLEVTEHELGQYKHRLCEAEQRNDTLTNDLRNLQERVKELRNIEEKFKLFTQQHEAAGEGVDGGGGGGEDEPSSSGIAGRPRSYYEQKIRLLELELNDLRRRTVDREHEMERINNELMTERRKRHMVRSRSQEDSEVADLRRQLQSVEAELGQARNKGNALETENRRLVNENRRLTLRLSGTRSSFDENESMRQKIATLTDELSEAQTEITQIKELAAAAVAAAAAAATSSNTSSAQSPAPPGGVLAERASETTFRKQFEILQREKQHARDEYDRIVHRMTPFRKETATRQEMKEHIDKLESNLQSVLVQVQDRDTLVKKLKQDVAQKDEELRSPLNRDSQSGLTQQEVKSLQQKVDDLESKLSTSEARCDQLVEQLADEERMAKQAASDAVARRHLETEVRNLKQELAKQRLVGDDWSYREDELVRQVQDWQNKHKVLKEANASQADLHAKELNVLEQQYRTQVDELAALVRTKDTAIHYAEVEKRKATEDLEALRFDMQCQSETSTSKTRAFEERVKELESLLERERKQAADASAAHERAVQQQKLKTDDAQLQMDQFEADLREAKRAYDEMQLKMQREARTLKEDKTKLETEIRVLKSDLSSARKEVRRQRRTNQSMSSEDEQQLAADKAAGIKRPSSAQAVEMQARLAVLEEQVAAKDEELDGNEQQLEELRKELNEMRTKLRDVTKSEAELREHLERKTQNLSTVDRSWKNERDDYQRKLRHEDKIHNAEISAVQMRFENKQKVLEDENKSLKSTLKQYKKESENLRTRLEANMRECGELKRAVGELEKKQRDPYELKPIVVPKTADVATAPKSPSVILRSMSSSVTSLVADENTIATLKLENEKLKSELSKLERDRQDVKTKATRERSSYELKISELQTRLSQLENKTFQFGILGLKRTPTASTPTSRDDNKKHPNAADDTLARLTELTAELETTKKENAKQVNELKQQLDNLNVEKEKSSEFWKKKFNELQDRFTQANDQTSQLEYTYAKVRSEYDVLRIERDDLAERLMDAENFQAVESQKIDQMLAEIQNIRHVVVEIEKDGAGVVLGDLVEEEEAAAADTTSAPRSTAKTSSLTKSSLSTSATAQSAGAVKPTTRLNSARSSAISPSSSHLKLPSHFDKQAARSAELQKAIDKISRFSEDIKAERRSRTRRSAKPVSARSLSASLADARRRSTSSSGHHAHSMAMSSTGLNNTTSVSERAAAYVSNLVGGQTKDTDDADSNASVASSMTSLTAPHYPINLPRRQLGPGLVVTTPAGIDLPSGASDMYGTNMPRSRSMEGSRDLGSTTISTSVRSSSTHRVKSNASSAAQQQQSGAEWSSIDSNTSDMTNFGLGGNAAATDKRMSMPNIIGGDSSPTSSRHKDKGFKHLLKNWTRKSASDKRGMFSKTKSEQHGAMTTSSIESSSEVSSPVVAAGLQAMSAVAPASAAAGLSRTRNVSGDSTMSTTSSSMIVVDHKKISSSSSPLARPTSSASTSTNRTYVKPPSSESEAENRNTSLASPSQQHDHSKSSLTNRLRHWRAGAKEEEKTTVTKSVDHHHHK